MTILLFFAIFPLSGATTTAATSSSTCVQRSFSTKKKYDHSTCIRYIHTIMIGDGIVLTKASTSTYFTASTKTAVKAFQKKYIATTGKITGSVGANTWRALCAVAEQRKLAEYDKAGCALLAAQTTSTTAASTVTNDTTETSSGTYQTTNLSIASWNTLYTNKTSNVAQGASALAAQADIIAFQELNFPDRRSAIRKAIVDCDTCAFTGYFPDSTGKGWGTKATVSIAWNKYRFTALETGTYSVLGPNAFKANTSNKWVNWVKLRDDKTGKVFYFLNTHFAAGVELGGKARSDAHKGQLKNYQHHMNDLVNLINKFKADGTTVFVAGDFNVNYRLDTTVSYFPHAALTALGMHSSWERFGLAGIDSRYGSDTDTSRIIDYIWSPDEQDLTPVSATISDASYGSDHRPVMYTTTVNVTVPDPEVPPVEPPVDPTL